MPNQMIALQARAPRIPTYNQLVAGRDANLARQNALAIQEQAMQQTAATQAKAARDEAAMANALKLAQTGDIAGAEKQFGLGAGNLEVHKTLTGLQDEQLKQARTRLVAAGAASLAIKQAPDEASRRALLTQLTPQLQAAGWTAEQIAGFPLDDKSLETAITNAISPDDTIKAHMEAQKGYTLAPGAARFEGGKKIAEQPANVPQGTIIDYIGPDGQPAKGNIVNGKLYPVTIGDQRPAGPGLVGGPRGGVAGALQTNPGALKDGAFAKSQPGYTGASGGFATFATPEAGIAAQEALLRGSYVNKGYNTIDKIVNRYAPPGPENSAASVSNYKKYIAGQTGIDINQPITAAQVPAVAKAMREFETGQRPGGAAPGQVVRPVPSATQVKMEEREQKQHAKAGSAGAQLDKQISDIERLLNSPVFNDIFGSRVGLLPAAVIGVTDQRKADALNLWDTVTASGTLSALLDLKDSGGTLGQVSNYEDQMLGKTAINPSRTSSPEAIRANLERRLKQLRVSKARIEGAYAKDFGRSYAQAESGVAPSAAAAPKRLKFNPATGDFE